MISAVVALSLAVSALVGLIAWLMIRDFGSLSAYRARDAAMADRDLALGAAARAELESDASKAAVLRLRSALEDADKKLRDHEAKAIDEASGDALLDLGDRVLSGDGAVPRAAAPAAGDHHEGA